MYIDKTYIETRFPADDLKKIARRDDDETMLDETRINAYIEDAEADINLKLSGRYIIPLDLDAADAEARKIIQRICYDITMYYLISIRFTDEPMDTIKSRYEAAIQRLNSIALGQEDLNLPKKPLASVILVNKTLDDRKFTNDILKNL